MKSRIAMWITLGLAAFWRFSDWQSIYMVDGLALMLALGITATWALLNWLTGNESWFERDSYVQLTHFASRLAKWMQFAAVLLALVTVELLSSRAIMPLREETAVLERMKCYSSGGARYGGPRTPKDMDGDRMCLLWHTGQIGSIERLALDEWPALKGLVIGDKLEVIISRQDSWLWGQGAWYRLDH